MMGGSTRDTHRFFQTMQMCPLTLNTDGVAIFRSSKTSVWPVWLVINELPKGMR